MIEAIILQRRDDVRAAFYRQRKQERAIASYRNWRIDQWQRAFHTARGTIQN